jgi:hypothetical protein
MKFLHRKGREGRKEKTRGFPPPICADERGLRAERNAVFVVPWIFIRVHPRKSAAIFCFSCAPFASFAVNISFVRCGE